MAADARVALELEVGGEAAEAVHLVAHFGGRGARGTAEVGRERVGPGEEGVELVVESVAGRGEAAFAFDGEGTGAEALGELVGMGGEDVFKGELVLIEEFGDGGLDEGGGEPWQDGGGAAEDSLVEDLVLGVVGDFRGATDDGLGGEHVILKDGAEEGVGTEALGGGVEDGEEVGGGVLGFRGRRWRGLSCGLSYSLGSRASCRRSYKPGAVFAMEGKAGAGGFINKEEEAGAGGDEDLGMVAALGEEPVTLVEGGFEVGGVFDGVAENGGAEGVEGAGGSVDDDEAVVGEKRREEASEGAGEGGLRRVGGGEEVEFGSATDELGGAIEDGGNVGAEGEIADGAGGGDGVKIEMQGVEGVAGGEGDVVGFGEVVIFRGEPEDGDGIGILSTADDGSGFEEGEEGSGEEGDLLAGDDSARSLPTQANRRLEWGTA